MIEIMPSELYVADEQTDVRNDPNCKKDLLSIILNFFSIIELLKNFVLKKASCKILLKRQINTYKQEKYNVHYTYVYKRLREYTSKFQ